MNAALTIPQILNNKSGLYAGNLRYYFKIMMRHASNLKNPYHNFRHMMHVVFLCYSACKFYHDQLTKKEMRELLLAAFFHDFNHIGRTGNDDVNIQVALWSFKQYMTQADAASFSAIEALIKRTGYPYKTDKIVPSLSGRILRDADVSQALSVAWVQQVVLGLSSEMSIDPIKVFEMQEGFLKNITFETDWANQLFAKEVIWAKIQETKSYLEIYNGNDESPWDETYALVEHAWLPYGKKHKFF